MLAEIGDKIPTLFEFMACSGFLALPAFIPLKNRGQRYCAVALALLVAMLGNRAILQWLLEPGWLDAILSEFGWSRVVGEFASWNAPFVLAILLQLLIYPRLWRASPAGLCRGCGYNLTGNVSGFCPECGTPITLKPGEGPQILTQGEGLNHSSPGQRPRCSTQVAAASKAHPGRGDGM